jgi:hypothetical protein
MIYVPSGPFLMGLSEADLAWLLSLCRQCHPSGLSDQLPQLQIILE